MTLKKKLFILMSSIYVVSSCCRPGIQGTRLKPDGIVHLDNVFGKTHKDRYMDCTTGRGIALDTLFHDLVFNIGPVGAKVARDPIFADSLKVYLRLFDLLALGQNFNRTVFQLIKSYGDFEITMIRYQPNGDFPVAIHALNKKVPTKEISNPAPKEQLVLTNPMSDRHQKSWYIYLASGQEVRLDTLFQDLSLEVSPNHRMAVDSTMINSICHFAERLEWVGQKYQFNRISIKIRDDQHNRTLYFKYYIPGAVFPLHYRGYGFSQATLQQIGSFR